MADLVVQPSKVGKVTLSKQKSPNSQRYVDIRTREFLLPEELEAMRDAIKKRGDRHAHRDAFLI